MDLHRFEIESVQIHPFLSKINPIDKGFPPAFRPGNQ